MKTLFIASGDITWASSRIRAYWPAQHMQDTRVVTIEEANRGGIDGDVEAVIWQKTADIKAMTEIHEAGIQQWLDLCDPVYWFNPGDFKTISQMATGIVVSTMELARDLANSTGYEFAKLQIIPDRLNLEHYPIRRRHEPRERVRFIWYGLQANRPGLYGALSFLERLACDGHKIELTICDDRPDLSVKVSERFPTYYVQWNLDQENAIISSHDIVLTPKYPGAWGLLKSNNKTLTAWACGLPVDDCMDYGTLVSLVRSHLMRDTAAAVGYSVLRNNYQSFQSAIDWERLLEANQ